MKKIIFTITCLIAILMVMSCASTGGNRTTDQERRVDGRIPLEIRNAIRNAPEDALVGVGTARMASLNQSRTISATRARAELSRQMDTIVRDMVRDYTASSEIDHSASLSFQENITVALSQSRLQGSSIVDEIEDDRGNYWTIVMLNKTSTVNEINQAVAAAKLRVPAMASFDAERRMNDAFDKFVGTNQVGFSDRD
jgi:hypothetical protein